MAINEYKKWRIKQTGLHGAALVIVSFPIVKLQRISPSQASKKRKFSTELLTKRPTEVCGAFCNSQQEKQLLPQHLGGIFCEELLHFGIGQHEAGHTGGVWRHLVLLVGEHQTVLAGERLP